MQARLEIRNEDDREILEFILRSSISHPICALTGCPYATVDEKYSPDKIEEAANHFIRSLKLDKLGSTT